MKNVTVIERRTGKRLALTRSLGDALVKMGRASYEAKAPATKDDAPKATKKATKKRAYKRRDMQAEE